MTRDEQAFPGRHGGVVRVDDTARRLVTPWTDSVDALLAHLASRGFDGAPRALGRDDAGRQVLSWIDGEVRSATTPGTAFHTRQSLAESARLLRSFHDAMRGFDPPDSVWKYAGRARAGSGQLIGHGDIGPWNIVYRDGLPVGLIDFDSAGPVHAVVEAAQAAWSLVPLWGPDELRGFGLDDIPDRASRLKTFADAYGITDRTIFLVALVQTKTEQLSYVRRWPVTASDAADHLRRVAEDLDRLTDWLPELATELGVANPVERADWPTLANRLH